MLNYFQRLLWGGFFGAGLNRGEGHLQLQRAKADLHPGSKLEELPFARSCSTMPACGISRSAAIILGRSPVFPGRFTGPIPYLQAPLFSSNKLVLLKAVRFSLLCLPSFLKVRSDDHLRLCKKGKIIWPFLRTFPCSVDRGKSDCHGLESRNLHFKQAS